MARPLTHEEFQELINDQDLFRLTVLGHAALEGLVTESLLHALKDDPPKRLVRAQFSLQVTLLVGLGIITEALGDALQAFSLIRNNWVHGNYEAEPSDSELLKLSVKAAAAYPGRGADEGLSSARATSDRRFILATALMALHGSLESFRDGFLERKGVEALAFPHHFTPRSISTNA